jgi:hypothetical protein
MDLQHALTLAQARSFVAALADGAVDTDASAAFERVLIELDWLHDDESPGLVTDGLSDDRDVLYPGRHHGDRVPRRLRGRCARPRTAPGPP